ncbi:LRR receptor-like serine/threonine-protein kinase FLS2 [Vitis vinifera]|uniref:LRR receptor-like serine/threonine-protein kinase FLS2 n=1 Tax=Vitis vinifera TaxID=29760 RepID=A0A438JWV0_VITVI|nr:LRR receptor-like serine/threonine-protein kinase FLS2 [Vitis vinifera]
MRNNSFHGRIPHEFPDVQYVDLSYNSFTGSLPSFLLLGSVEHLHLQGNAFTGSIPKHVLNPEFLFTLDLGDNNLSGKIPHSIGQFSELRVLSLRRNNFIGQIPNSLCQLSKMSILDLSNNSFSGPIPHCFNNMTFGKRGANEFYAFFQGLILFFSRRVVYKYVGLQGREPAFTMRGRNEDPYLQYGPQDEVEFITKSRHGIYKGDILNFMSGLDLSSNNLTGKIPYELGQLNSIHPLNLSNNRLIGSIPKDFSKLHQLESLDLSYNSLSGEIPPQLTNLNFLAVFIVAHNNFSGRIPDMKAQFGTFDESSYDGNPFLCGSMIKRKCEKTVVDQPPTMLYDESEGKWYDIDPVVFSASFVASYITILLVFVALLYINPYWRRRWFYLIEECIYSCYYAASDMLYKFSALLYK